MSVIEKFKQILIDKYNLKKRFLDQIFKEFSYISNSPTDLKTATKLIVESGLLTEEQVTKALAELDGVEYFDYFANAEIIDKKLIDRFPSETKQIIKREGFIPLFLDENNKEIVIGFKNARSQRAYNYALETINLAGLKDYRIKKVLVSLSAIEDYIFYNLKRIEASEIEKKASAIKVNIETTDEDSDTAFEDRTGVRDFLTAVIAKCVFDKVSDIHFEPKDMTGRIKIRKNGVLENLVTLDIGRYSVLAKYIENISTGIDPTKRGVAQDGRIENENFFKALKNEYGITEVDFRVSTIPNLTANESIAEYSTDSIVIRLLSRRGGIPSLDRLGFNVFVRKSVETISSKATGIFLITGPTGSGKTTTLYSILSRINAVERNIITVEDPVEYKNPMWKQTQVNKNYSFHDALVHMLRHDPDVILLGEIRDGQTAEQAFRAANTGHLVLSTLHTNDSATAILRLLDLGVDKFLVANTILAISAQRLVRQVCPFCSVEREITDEDQDFIRDNLSLLIPEEDIDRYMIKGKIRYRGDGCPKCDYKGYTKRTVISELLQFTASVRKRISEGHYNYMQDLMIKQYENNLLWLDGLDKVKQGVTTIEELRRIL